MDLLQNPLYWHQLLAGHSRLCWIGKQTLPIWQNQSSRFHPVVKMSQMSCWFDTLDGAMLRLAPLLRRRPIARRFNGSWWFTNPKLSSYIQSSWTRTGQKKWDWMQSTAVKTEQNWLSLWPKWFAFSTESWILVCWRWTFRSNDNIQECKHHATHLHDQQIAWLLRRRLFQHDSSISVGNDRSIIFPVVSTFELV